MAVSEAVPVGRGSSAIEWTESTWNPVTGCDRISPGCDNCYALSLAAKFKKWGQPKYQRDGDPRTSGPGFGLTLHPGSLSIPLKRRKPTMYFVNSMSDLFHKDVPDDFIAQVFDVMAICPQHTFQVLTKRPKRMARTVAAYYHKTGRDPLQNVWLGTSIESRTYVGRAQHLRETPAAVRFISAEPLLGPLLCESDEDDGWPHRVPVWNDGYDGDQLDLERIDWLIVGGESGPRHRPVDIEWVRMLRDACRDSQCPECFRDRDRVDCDYCHCDGGTGTAFFFKQWGGRTAKSGGRGLDGRTWDEMPESAS